MTHKVEVPKGSGQYYAYSKEKGKTTYMGTWANHLREVKLEESFKELFSKSRPVDTHVMVSTANIRHFRNNSMSEDDIDLAIKDLREHTEQVIYQKFPEYEGMLREIWISNEPTFSGIQLKQSEVISTGRINLEIPQDLVLEFNSHRNAPGDQLDAVVMRFGTDLKGLNEAIEREASLHYIKNHYNYQVEKGPDSVVVRIPTDEKALELEEDFKARNINLKTDVMYTGTIQPKPIQIEVGARAEQPPITPPEQPQPTTTSEQPPEQPQPTKGGQSDVPT